MGYLNEDELLTIQCIVLGIADAKSTGVDHQNISMKTLEEIAGVIQKQQDIIDRLDAKVAEYEKQLVSMAKAETDGGGT